MNSQSVEIKRAVVLLSGGLDSTVLLHRTIKHIGLAPQDVVALNISYGQKHAKESEFARYQADLLGVKYIEADLSDVFRFDTTNPLLNHGDMPEGDYAGQLDEHGIVTTYIPFRNGLFLSYAAALALQFDCNTICIGAHQDDAASAYPDCTPEFIQYMGNTIAWGTGQQVQLHAPFWNYKKRDIVREGMQLDVDFDKTWSCYNGTEEPCNVCATCIDRNRAIEAIALEFVNNGGNK